MPSRLPIAERQLLLTAQIAAVRFFRLELLQSGDGWAAECLRRCGAAHVMKTESSLPVGHATRRPGAAN